VQVVKQRVQAQQAASSWAALRHTLATSGARGLYVGYWTTVMREVRFVNHYFILVEDK